MKQIELKALAKINLGLDVLGRRENGYHDVRMIMQSVYLYDDVVIVRKDLPGIEVETNLHFLPTDENNIAYKAAAMLMEEFKLPGGVRIVLNKHIPVAAGMAGGEFQCSGSFVWDEQDVPFGLKSEISDGERCPSGSRCSVLYYERTVLAEGIGEELTTLPALPACTVLIAKPPISVSTKVVYEALDAKEIVDHPDIDGIIRGLETGSLSEIAAHMGNVLEDVTIGMYPVIEKIKDEMKKAGALNAMMSGSGPTVFGIFEAVRQRAERRSRSAGRHWQNRYM